MSRPPDSRSSVSAIFATMAGERYGTPSTRVAIPIREVRAAIHVNIVHVSYVADVPHGWSDVDTKSYPSSSARNASRTGSRPTATAGGTSRPKIKSDMAALLRFVGFDRGAPRRAINR